MSSQICVRASGSCCKVWGATWQFLMGRNIMSQWCSIAFRSGDREVHSIVSIPSSYRYYLHTLVTWGWAVSTRPTTGRRAFRPPLWSLFRIVWAETLTLQGMISAQAVPPCTKEQVLVLLMCWGPSTALSISPRITASLLKSSPRSGDCAMTGHWYHASPNKEVF